MENSRTIHSVSEIKFYRNSASVIFILFHRGIPGKSTAVRGKGPITYAEKTNVVPKKAREIA
jgi:hypothetical protein